MARTQAMAANTATITTKPSTSASQYLRRLYDLPPTMNNQLIFWMAYLRQILPAQLSLLNTDTENTRRRKQINIGLRSNGNMLMAGLVAKQLDKDATAIAAGDTWAELGLLLPPPVVPQFFVADRKIAFYTLIESPRFLEYEHEGSFHPIRDYEAVSRYLNAYLQIVTRYSLRPRRLFIVDVKAGFDAAGVDTQEDVRGKGGVPM